MQRFAVDASFASAARRDIGAVGLYHKAFWTRSQTLMGANAAGDSLVAWHWVFDPFLTFWAAILVVVSAAAVVGIDATIHFARVYLSATEADCRSRKNRADDFPGGVIICLRACTERAVDAVNIDRRIGLDVGLRARAELVGAGIVARVDECDCDVLVAGVVFAKHEYRVQIFDLSKVLAMGF